MTAFLICWFVFVAGVFIIVLFNRSRRNENLQATGSRTTGTLVRNQICWGRIIVVRPVIRFQTHAGQTVELLEKNGMALAIPRYSAGQSVQVIYNPTDPTDFRIA